MDANLNLRQPETRMGAKKKAQTSTLRKSGSMRRQWGNLKARAKRKASPSTRSFLSEVSSAALYDFSKTMPTNNSSRYWSMSQDFGNVYQQWLTDSRNPTYLRLNGTSRKCGGVYLFSRPWRWSRAIEHPSLIERGRNEPSHNGLDVSPVPVPN